MSDGTSESQEHEPEHWWIAAMRDDEAPDNTHVLLTRRGVLVKEARRHAPVRVGARLVVPTDRGARLLEVRSGLR